MTIQQLPDTSRIWIYQSSRAFTPSDIATIKEVLSHFIASWQSHGSEIKGAFDILYNQFIVVAADESHTSASGCSIDKSVAALRQIDENIKASLLERGNLCFLKDNKVEYVEFKDIKSYIQQGLITANTLVFNNQIVTLSELPTQWLVAANATWLSRFFKTVQA